MLFDSIRERHDGWRFIYTDGSKDGSKVGLGLVSGNVTFSERLPDRCSIYTAELTAILRALEYIENTNAQKAVICTDSLSAVTAFEHLSIDNPLIQLILVLHNSLVEQGFNVVFCWVPGHMDISGNEKADKAAKNALSQDITETKVPYTDFRAVASQFIRSSWQLDWDELIDNKLQQISPKIGKHPNFYLSRRDQLVLTRARIGHTYLTHGYLLRGEYPPVCVPCAVPLTVKHILIECADLEETRGRHYQATNLASLFEEVAPFRVVDFLREAGLYNLF